ncbi:MAG: PilZ domain-containing protein [Bryobacterales bacterium]|nr:PilZ domain-containing protein [Bryobacterales bacterium]
MNDQRRNQRFDLRLPVQLVRSGSRPLSGAGETRNLSSSGVLFSGAADVAIGQPVEYTIGLPTGSMANELHLRCVGKVVRREQNAWAMTMDRYEFIRSA